MSTEESNEQTTDAAPSGGGNAATRRASLTKVLPSDRLTLDRQVEALKAYAAVYEANGGNPVTNAQAGEVAKMSANTIVVTNAFFTDIGLLTRLEGAFAVAPEAVAFLTAFSGISPETASEKLKPLFEKQWFMQLLAPRLRLGPMDISAVHRVLGEASSAGKEHIPRLELLIDFLCFVGLTKREGNQLFAGAGSPVGMNLNLGGGVPPVIPPVPPKPDEDVAGLEKYTLTLDASKKRKIVIYSPPEVTATELKRIQQWLSFQLLVTDQEREA
ncbi:MAG: hypothetical protein QOI07_1898 [Verrucomicrobiota bacterium]|jgi:hypothetical protein